MFRALMELDKLSESSVVKEPMLQESMSRQELIAELENLGRHYDFSKYSDAQLFRIWERVILEKEEQDAWKDYSKDKAIEASYSYCEICGTRLNPLDQCPICDLGEEDLDEGIFDNPVGRSNWIVSNSTPANKGTQNTPNQAIPTTPAQPTPAPSVATSDKYVVVITLDRGRLRALATDGIHPAAWVSFPNNLRNYEGQKYEVDQLIWNGKNYRVAGNITPINSINSVSNAQNVTENIINNKETSEMNFQTILEELDHLYEADEQKRQTEQEVNNTINEDASDAPAEDVGEEEIDIEIVDDEVADDTPKQLILECANCGAIVIKEESDVETDEETDSANTDEACQYCEETKGYKIIGIVAPYKDTETIKEGIFNRKKSAGEVKIKTVSPSEVKVGDRLVLDREDGDFEVVKVKKIETEDGMYDFIHRYGNMVAGSKASVDICEGIFDKFKKKKSAPTSQNTPEASYEPTVTYRRVQYKGEYYTISSTGLYEWNGQKYDTESALRSAIDKKVSRSFSAQYPSDRGYSHKWGHSYNPSTDTYDDRGWYHDQTNSY